MALMIVIGLHVAMVAGLLAIKVVDGMVSEALPPLQLRNIDEHPRRVPDQTPIDAPRDRALLIPQRTVDLPRPLDGDVFRDAEEGEVQPLPLESQGGGTEPAVPADTPLKFQAVRSSDDYYPPQAIRMAAEGSVIIRACVDGAGRLSGMPTVVKSSRESLLDGAAVKWAAEALRFEPATHAGIAVEACKDFRVSFKLR